MRLDKFLAQASIGSRKVVRNYVKNGYIRVNEFIETDPAVEINEVEDQIQYLNEKVLHLGKICKVFFLWADWIRIRKVFY